MYPPIDLKAISQEFKLPDDQYYRRLTEKSQICLHHTASGKGVTGDWRHFLSDSIRVATPVIVGDDKIYQLFYSGYWGHHLGIKKAVFDSFGIPAIYRKTEQGKSYHANNEILNEACLGIEIDSWGPLVFFDGAYRSYVGTKVPKEEVQEYSMGFKTIPKSSYFDEIGVTGKTAHLYQKYTDNQITFSAQLINFWAEVYEIPKTYNPKMWDVCKEALQGDPGVWSHVSYRSDKMDCHPQPELIEMLKSL